MLERLLKLYTAYMIGDVRSPMPHLFGPPGCGKSTVVEQLAQLVEKQLHIINVSRISPLELEGVQMPHGSGEEMVLKLLPSTFWTQLREGDILLMDEFLRGFPEVYNGLLDIFTARQVGGFELPKVFIIGASNSTVAYDKALEDRMLHIPVDDVRKTKAAKKFVAGLITDALGLYPQMQHSSEMDQLITIEVFPMYAMLDGLGKGTNSAVNTDGKSVRNLIGQARLREISSAPLAELIQMNNHRAMTDGKPQYVLLPDGKNANVNYRGQITKIDDDKLSPIQLQNKRLNIQLIDLEVERHNTRKKEADDADITDDELDDLLG